ncbi:MAG: MFS transporter [Dehalococcoidia bacterium]
MRSALTLFHERNFAFLFAGRCVNFLGNAMAPVALAFAVLDLTDSASALGLVLAARMVPQVIFLLIGGVVSDRFPRHQVLVGTSLVAGASQLGVAVLLIGGWAELWQIVVLEVINGAAFALFYPADSSVVPLTVPQSRLQEANAVLRLGTNLCMVGGAALAGLLVALLSPGWAIAVDAATFFVGALLVAGMRGISAAAGASSSIIHDLKEGWNEFIAHRWLWTIVVQFSIMLIGFFGGFLVLGPVVADNEMSGASSWAIIVAAQSVGLLAGGLIVVRWRASRPILVATLSVFVTALPLAAMAMGGSVGVVALAAFAMGVSFEVFSVYWYTALHEHVAPESLARVSSYDALGSMGLSPLGLVAAGPLSDWIGVDQTLWLCVALILVPTALVLLVPEVRNLRSTPRVREVDVGLPAEAAAG